MRELEDCFVKIKKGLLNGIEYNEGKYMSTSYKTLIEYTKPTDFIEKEIKGSYYRIFKDENI